VAEKPVPKPEPVVDPKPEPLPSEKSPEKQNGVLVQIGVFTPSPKVEQIQAKVSGLGFNCGTEPITAKNGSKLLRMRCGPFASKDEAQKAQQKLKAAGYNNSILVAHQ
jgi:DedD protein